MDEGFSELHLHSSLASEYREAIEDLFFFNPKQGIVRDRVRQHVERYGKPGIRSHEGLLSLELSGVEQAQALFIVLDKLELIGVLLYVREGECLRVLYMALTPKCTKTWRASCVVISRVLAMLRKLAKNIKGVRRIEFSLDRRTWWSRSDGQASPRAKRRGPLAQASSQTLDLRSWKPSPWIAPSSFN